MEMETKEKHVFEKAINKYIDLLNSQMETFPIIMNTLVARLQASTKKMKKFMDTNNIKQTEEGDNITISVPVELNKEFVKHNTAISQAISAIQLIPQNIVVAFVSIYDAYLSDLIEGIYTICPDLLRTCEREYSFSEILRFDSIEAIKRHIIEKEVETVLRESHTKQFEWLSKKVGVSLTEDLPNFNAFIEITERRNLFVHTNGKVSRQYLSIVSDSTKNDNLKIGDILTASPDYVVHCYHILFEIGVKLGQVIWRKLDEKNSLEQADCLLMDIVYDLLKSKKYDLAIILSEFSTKKYVKSFNQSHDYVKCINKALGYYLVGDSDKCKSIINNVDWSATELKYKLAIKVLVEDFVEACAIMKEIGANDYMKEAYREWPLFTKFRDENSFKETYKGIYQVDFDYIETKPLRWEDIIKEAIELNKMVEKEKSVYNKVDDIEVEQVLN